MELGLPVQVSEVLTYQRLGTSPSLQPAPHGWITPAYLAAVLASCWHGSAARWTRGRAATNVLAEYD